MYTVAFANGSLPANVDQLVGAAGGTIVVRLPEIGGLGVVSSSATFAARMSASASVAAAEKSARTSIGPTEAGGTFGSAVTATHTQATFSRFRRHHAGGGERCGCRRRPATRAG